MKIGKFQPSVAYISVAYKMKSVYSKTSGFLEIGHGQPAHKSVQIGDKYVFVIFTPGENTRFFYKKPFYKKLVLKMPKC